MIMLGCDAGTDVTLPFLDQKLEIEAHGFFQSIPHLC